MTITAERDAVQDQLCARIDELEREKEVLAIQLDRAEEELAEAKRAQTIMRDTFATQAQQAVSRARRDWAAQGSPWVKAQWQAEILEYLERKATDHRDPSYPVVPLAEVQRLITEKRRQAEGGDHAD